MVAHLNKANETEKVKSTKNKIIKKTIIAMSQRNKGKGKA